MSLGDPKNVISHWNCMIEGLSQSPQDFFDKVKAAIEAKEIEGIRIGISTYREGGMLSGKREYLRIVRQDLVYDICGAPFGNGFFVSWWLGQRYTPGGIFASIPIIGPLLFRPYTYFQIDTAAMFQSLVHSAVTEAVDQISGEQKVPLPDGVQSKPVMRDFWQ